MKAILLQSAPQRSRRPFIAIGKITLLQGDPGDGKSTMMMNLIAELSTGGKTPDGSCDLQIGITAKISLNRVDHDQARPEFNDCLTDALIV